jgi:hypothetical protein
MAALCDRNISAGIGHAMACIFERLDHNHQLLKIVYSPLLTRYVSIKKPSITAEDERIYSARHVFQFQFRGRCPHCTINWSTEASLIEAHYGWDELCNLEVCLISSYHRRDITDILSTWIALAGSLGLVMPSGSSVAFLYGFIFCVLCNLCLGASLGEMASIWPTAGGQVCTNLHYS